MKNKEVAAAYGVKLTTVDHWPAARREQAKADLATGFKPKVAQKLSELVYECYRASMRTKKKVNAEPSYRFDNLFNDWFTLWVFNGGQLELHDTYALTVEQLDSVIEFVKEL